MLLGEQGGHGGGCSNDYLCQNGSKSGSSCSGQVCGGPENCTGGAAGWYGNATASGGSLTGGTAACLGGCTALNGTFGIGGNGHAGGGGGYYGGGGLPFQVTLISEFLEVVDQVGLAVANLHIFLWVVSIREMAR